MTNDRIPDQLVQASLRILSRWDPEDQINYWWNLTSIATSAALLDQWLRSFDSTPADNHDLYVEVDAALTSLRESLRS